MNKKKVVAGLGILLLPVSVFSLETECVLSCNVWVDKTCGSTYDIDDFIVIFFAVNESAYVELWLTYPDGYTKKLTSTQVTGGMAYHIRGKVGALRGRRTLTLRAQKEGTYSEDTCIYYGGESPGSLYIESSPSGAKCYLDDDYKGITPLTITDVPSGSHSIKITTLGYLKWTKAVTVYPNETTHISAILQKEPGSIHVISDPSGADCYLDGIYEGKTPLIIKNVSPGRHIITLKKDDYEDWEDSVYVSAGGLSTVEATLDIQTGALDVDSNVDGADVYLNDDYRGETPLEIDDIPIGDQKIQVSADKYYDFTGAITVEADETMYVEAFLDTKPGSIYVESTPPGAEVYLDNDYKGVTPLRISSLISGTYTLTLRHPGYTEETKHINVNPDETAKEKVIMRKAFWRQWYFILIIVLIMLPISVFILYLKQRLSSTALLMKIQTHCPICESVFDGGEIVECTYCANQGFTCRFHSECWRKHEERNKMKGFTRCFRQYGIYVPERKIKYPFQVSGSG